MDLLFVIMFCCTGQIHFVNRLKSLIIYNNRQVTWFLLTFSLDDQTATSESRISDWPVIMAAKRGAVIGQLFF